MKEYKISKIIPVISSKDISEYTDLKEIGVAHILESSYTDTVDICLYRDNKTNKEFAVSDKYREYYLGIGESMDLEKVQVLFPHLMFESVNNLYILSDGIVFDFDIDDRSFKIQHSYSNLKNLAGLLSTDHYLRLLIFGRSYIEKFASGLNIKKKDAKKIADKYKAVIDELNDDEKLLMEFLDF